MVEHLGSSGQCVTSRMEEAHRLWHALQGARVLGGRQQGPLAILLQGRILTSALARNPSTHCRMSWTPCRSGHNVACVQLMRAQSLGCCWSALCEPCPNPFVDPDLLPQDVLDYLAWSGHDVAGARLMRAQPRQALQLVHTLAEAGVSNMETLVVEA